MVLSYKQESAEQILKIHLFKYFMCDPEPQQSDTDVVTSVV